MRERLRRTPLDTRTLQLIEELGVARRKRGRRRRSDSDAEPPAPRANLLAQMGFVRSARSLKTAPPPSLAEIAFAGRSNVGKSSLLNALCGNRAPGRRGTVGIASVANKPGVTKTLNFYANPAGAQLVDLPGYGFAYAAEEQLAAWQETMRDYLAKRGDPLRVLLLIDARQSLKQSDRDFALWLDREALAPLHVVMSKCDLVEATELARRYTLLVEELRKLQLRNWRAPVHMVSAKTMGGVELLRASLAACLPESIVEKGRTKLHAARRIVRASEKAAASEKADTAPEVEVTTPAARRFAEQLAARKAAPPAPPPVRRGAEAARERAERAMFGDVGREKQHAMATNFSRRRIAKRRERNRPQR